MFVKKKTSHKIGPANIEYWINRGLSHEQAKNKIEEIQNKAKVAKYNKAKLRLLEKLKVGDKRGSRSIVNTEFKSGSELGKSTGALYVLVRCDCGRRDWIRGKSFINNECIFCPNCAHLMERSATFGGYNDMPGRVWSRIKNNESARVHTKNTLDFDARFVWELMNKQNYKCALSGVDLDWESASLDRKNSQVGYMSNNIQWVHKVVNLMKHSLDESEFLTWCEKIVKYKNL